MQDKSKDMKRKNKKQEPTLEQRIAEIKKPQTDVFGNVIQPVAEPIIEQWVAMVTESVELGKICDLEYTRRAKAEEKQISKEQYESLHTKANELLDKIARFRDDVQKQTGFFLKWAI